MMVGYSRMPGSLVCPTCGDALRTGQEECPNCGSIIAQHQAEESLPPQAEPLVPNNEVASKIEPNLQPASLLKPLQDLLTNAQVHEQAGDLSAALETYRQAKLYAVENQGKDPAIQAAVQMLDLLIGRTEQLLAPTGADQVAETKKGETPVGVKKPAPTPRISAPVPVEATQGQDRLLPKADKQTMPAIMVFVISLVLVIAGVCILSVGLVMMGEKGIGPLSFHAIDTSMPTKTSINTFTHTPTISSTPTLGMSSTTDGNWIAYAYGIEQNKRDLYMINWQTLEVRPITFDGQGDNGPNFSPDGRSMVFSRCVTGSCFLFMRDENGHETQLTEYKSMWPAWCSDPSKPWIIFENRADGKDTNIWMIDLINQQMQRLTNGGKDLVPEWSPDCSRFSFIRDTNNMGDIYLFDMNTRSEQQLTYTPDVDEWSTRWSPDGEWLVYNCLMDTDGDGFINTDHDVSDLMIIRTDGSEGENLTHGQYWAYSPSWSPDGSKISFAAFYQAGESQLVILDLHQLIFTEFTNIGPYYHPVWGP